MNKAITKKETLHLSNIEAAIFPQKKDPQKMSTQVSKTHSLDSRTRALTHARSHTRTVAPLAFFRLYFFIPHRGEGKGRV